MSKPIDLEPAIRDYLVKVMGHNSTLFADDWARGIMGVIEEHLGAAHYVTFNEVGWHVEHSFACRVAGTLDTCEYGTAIRENYGDEPDDELIFGRWRITLHEGGPLGFDRAEEED